MLIKVVVCDDKIACINNINLHARKYFEKHDFDVEYFQFTDSFAFLESYNNSGGYDIILLDVCMPGLLGTDVARELRRKKDKSEIIFITTSNHFAVDAFVLKATHYLVKPFCQEHFDEAMDRAVAKILSQHCKNITFKLSGGIVRVANIDDILYIENFAHTQNIFLRYGDCLQAKESITQIMTKLDEVAKGCFFSPYKGFIVNMKAIITIEPSCIKLKSGAVIPIVKRSFKDLQKKYFDYMFQDGTVL